MTGRRKYIQVDEVKDLMERIGGDVRETRHATERTLTELNAEITKLRKELAKHSKKYSTMQSALVKTMTFLFGLLDDPDAKAHAAAVVRDYKFNANKIDNEPA